MPAFADALYRDAFGAETDGDRAKALQHVVDEFAVSGQVENLLVENPVTSDLGADQDTRPLRGRTVRHHRIEAAELLERAGRGLNILERLVRDDPALVEATVVIEFGH